jgi:hypothetical protein
MSFAELGSKLTRLLYPPVTRTVLLVTRAVTAREVEFFARVFDEVIVEQLASGEWLTPPPQIWFAKRVQPSKDHACERGYATWERSPVGQRLIFQSSNGVLVALSLRSAQDLAAPCQTIPGIVVDDLEPVHLHGLGAKFVMIQESETLLQAMTSAARSEILDRLFA